MLPGKIPVLDRFQMARDAGFEAIECPTTPDAGAAEELLAASRKTALPIHSVMNSEHWRSPLSSADPAVVEKSLEGMRTSLRNAKMWGADTVLLVPAVVNPETTYAQAWERSQRQIRKLIPLAEEARVIIGIEEVWNKFLLSPLEFARYVDEFASPWIRAYFDIGNVAIQGYPQDWIRTLGKRIVKLHFKDFSFKKKRGRVHAAAGGRDRLARGPRRARRHRLPGNGDRRTVGRRLGLPQRGERALRENSCGSGLSVLRRTCIRRVWAAGSEYACSGSRIRAASGPASSS